jgi:phosphatidylserine/phosphatidylglycerophosphate/cardiolipin synthase-like enzyme
MARFLTTTQISAELENLIKFAQDEITIISPYLKVNQRLQDFIEDADRRKIRFTLVYG